MRHREHAPSTNSFARAIFEEILEAFRYARLTQRFPTVIHDDGLHATKTFVNRILPPCDMQKPPSMLLFSRTVPSENPGYSNILSATVIYTQTNGQGGEETNFIQSLKFTLHEPFFKPKRLEVTGHTRHVLGGKILSDELKSSPDDVQQIAQEILTAIAQTDKMADLSY